MPEILLCKLGYQHKVSNYIQITFGSRPQHLPQQALQQATVN